MARRITHIGLLAMLATATGCHDGPLYALKAMNPYFRNQWAQDEKWGMTETTRRQTLEALAAKMPALSPEQQASYFPVLQGYLENDASPQNRFLAIQCGGKIAGDAGLNLLEIALKDDSTKVRIGACQLLMERSEPRAAELLAEAAGSDSSNDVRLAAVRALGKHPSSVAATALKGALQSDDPAFRMTAMTSLRQATGTDQGNTAEAWVAYLDQNPSLQSKNPTMTDRLKDLF